jgi:hypothetical protein
MAQQPRQQRIGVYGKFTPTTLDTSEADKMRALAGLGQTIAETSLAIAKPMVEGERAKQGEQAVKEGAGKIDPQTGEVLEAPEMANFKIGSAQYNQAAQQALAEKGRNAAAAYESAFRTDTTQAIEQAKIDYKDDPVGFQNWSKSFTEGSLSKINDPAMKAQANEYIVNRTFKHQLQLQDAFDTKLLNEQIEGITTEASDAFDQAKKLIISGDAIGARLEFDTSIKALQEVARMNPDFDVDNAIETLEREYDSAQFQARVSNIADTGDFAAANKLVLDEMDQVPENFSVEQWEATVNKARTALIKQKSLFDSAQEVSTQEDKAFFTNGLTVISSGGDLSSEDMVKMGQIAGDNPLLQKQINNATAVAVYSEMPFSQRQQVFENLDSSDPENMELLKGYALAEQNIGKSLRADPWGTAIQQGVLTEQEQADFDEFDVTALLTEDLTEGDQLLYQQAYKRNEQIAARLSEHYGIRFAPFNNQQIEAISRAIPEMSPDQQVELAESIGPDSAVWELLVDKGAGLYGTAATIEDSDIQRAIFVGNQRLNSGTVDPFRDTADLMRTTFNDVIADTLGNVEGGLAYEAAKAHYASTFLGKNIEYNPSDFEESINAIIGKVKSARGFKTIPPTYSPGNNDGTVNNLENFFDDMDLDTFLELGGAADSYTKTVTVGGAGPMRIGASAVEVQGDRNLEKAKYFRIKATNGKNMYELRHPTSGSVMIGADGNPLVIHVSEERMGNYLGNKYVEETESFANRMMQNRMPAAALQGGNIPSRRAPIPQSYENKDQGMLRSDGQVKSAQGFLGPLKRDDGGIMTEFSIGVEMDGQEVEIPSMVPTLTKTEIETLRTLPEGVQVPRAVQRKAVDHARKRIAAGLDPFYQDGE